MIRYCPNCKKEFDFPVRSMQDMERLVCPVCGGGIDRESRKPIDTAQQERMETAIGQGIMLLLNLWFYLYLICGVVGIIAFFLKWDALLYLVTALSVFLFFRPRGAAKKGGFFYSALWLLGGAGLGFFLFRTPQGACFGVAAALVIRHVVVSLFLSLVALLIGWVRRL